MFLSKQANGTYYLYYKDANGNRKSITTKEKTKAKAQQFLTQFKRQLEEDSERKVIRISLKQFRIKFLAYSETIHSWNHTKAIKASFTKLEEYYGDIYFEDLTSDKLQSYFEYRMRKLSSYTIRRDIANFSSAFKWAKSKKYLTENITTGLAKPKITEKLPVYFTRKQFDQLIKSIKNEDLKDLIIFAVNTGIRQSDLINLRWEQVNLKAKIVLLDNRNSSTKSRKVHSLPLNKTSLEILGNREKRGESEVFTYLGRKIKQDFISKKFKKLVKAAQLDSKLTFHTLRHTFATWLVQAGVPIYQVSKLMTHSDLRVTQIYAHLGAKDLFSAVEKLE